jgi:amino acid permease
MVARNEGYSNASELYPIVLWIGTIHNLSASLMMIALAGMIGTGLFLSSGKALVQAGPLGCVLGFMVVSEEGSRGFQFLTVSICRWALLLLASVRSISSFAHRVVG